MARLCRVIAYRLHSDVRTKIALSAHKALVAATLRGSDRVATALQRFPLAVPPSLHYARAVAS